MVRTCLFVLLLAGCAAPYMGDVEDALEREAKTYYAMLQAKIDRGEISEEEARYLATQKHNEIMQRYESAQRARRPQPIRFPRDTVTNCRPDGLGGTRCTTR